MPHITVRSVQRADLDILQKLITSLAAHHDDEAKLDINTLNRDIFGAHPWVRLSVAEIDQTVVGYTALCPLVQLQYCARGMDIHHIFVSASHRGSGVGRALIEKAQDTARALDCRYLMIGTTPENTAAQSTYVACGFKATPHNPHRFFLSLA